MNIYITDTQTGILVGILCGYAIARIVDFVWMYAQPMKK